MNTTNVILSLAIGVPTILGIVEGFFQYSYLEGVYSGEKDYDPDARTFMLGGGARTEDNLEYVSKVRDEIERLEAEFGDQKIISLGDNEHLHGLMGVAEDGTISLSGLDSRLTLLGESFNMIPERGMANLYDAIKSEPSNYR